MNFKRFISALLCVILSVSFLFLFGCADGNTDVTTTKADGEAVTESVSENAMENVTAAEIPSASDETSTQAAEEIKAPETVEEIVAYFNASANRIKTEATKVTKNWEKRYVDLDKLIVPSVLESTAKSMMSTFMKDDTEPIIYDTREEIVSEYIVPDQNYVSKLTPDAVTEAKCTDKGDTYEIFIRLKAEKNPTAGKGVGSVCDVIEAHEIAEKAPSMLEEMSTNYSNCTVTAVIDKESGRVISSVYSTPLVMYMKVNLFGTHVVQAAITFTKDYTIEY